MIYYKQFFRSVDDLLKRYPIRNPAWTYDPMGACFIAEISELDHKPTLLDPWNRLILDDKMSAIRNNDGEIEYWECSTSVCGYPLVLTVYND